MKVSRYDFNERQIWIDSLRGFAILIVIASHIATFFSETLSYYAVHSYFSAVVEAVGPLRMEVLYFLSGMLVPRSARKGRRAYITGKVNAILWPYFVWSAVMLILGYNNLSNNLVPALYGFSTSTWFLSFLFVYYIISDAARKLDFRIVFLIAYCLSIVLFITGSPVDRNFVKLWDFPYYYLYFMCGTQLIAIRESRGVFPEPLGHPTRRHIHGLGNGHRSHHLSPQDTSGVLSLGFGIVSLPICGFLKNANGKDTALRWQKFYVLLRYALPRDDCEQ